MIAAYFPLNFVIVRALNCFALSVLATTKNNMWLSVQIVNFSVRMHISKYAYKCAYTNVYTYVHTCVCIFVCTYMHLVTNSM